MITVRHSRDENILELVSSDHGVVVEDGSGCDVPVEDVIGNVVESLLSCFVLVHVERVIYFCRKYALAPGLYCVDWGLQVLHLRLPEHALVAYLVVPQTLADAG